MTKAALLELVPILAKILVKIFSSPDPKAMARRLAMEEAHDQATQAVLRTKLAKGKK